MSFPRLAAVILLAGSAQAAGGLDAIRDDPDPQRRYRAALDYSAEQITVARKAYEENRHQDFDGALKEVAAGARLCDETLRAPVNKRIRNASHYKRAELKLREVLRRLTQLEKEVSVDDRAHILKTRDAVQEIHDRLLLDITGRRRLGA